MTQTTNHPAAFPFFWRTSMITLRRSILLGLLLLAAAPAAHGQFPLKDGDIWVMAGDSITAQHLHSNYFEAFCHARYNKIKFGFRNSGVGGHTIPSTLARFDYDIAAWKPTVVSVELGMNDQGGTPTDKFVANMGTMVERIRSIKARPVILSASPINNGSTLAQLGSKNRLHEYAVVLKVFSATEKIPYADQFHPLVDIWAKNKPNENRLANIRTVQGIATNNKLPGVEHLRAFLAANEKDLDQLISIQGDAVHPGAPGQLLMAAALLKELGAESFVSNVTINAPGMNSYMGCKVTDLKSTDTGVSFDRLDDCLPFPIPDEARAALRLYPTILDMSQYTLKVTGLKTGSYVLKVNNVPIATLAAKELEAGVNLTAFGSDPAKSPLTKGGQKGGNPIAAQGKAVLAAVSVRAGLVGQWRNLSKAAHADKAPAKLMTDLAALTKKVEAADDAIRAAAQPKTLHFELTQQ
jgi:lysophospholipase L1-like esterase